jgi:enamine deaminase RidA (YjgF/YER057c/UK114 family)
MNMERKTVSRGSPLERKIGFARAARIGDWIAVSGTAPIGPDGATLHSGDLYAQTLACLMISVDAIEELGASKDDVIRTRVMLTDISRWEEAARAHGEVFSGLSPACTFVEVKGFIRRDWLVETEMDAVCGG